MKVQMKSLFSLLLIMVSFSAQAVTLSDERLVFRTNFGDLVVALYPEVAPQHTAQILKLAKMGVYENADIYRVEKGFVAQTENYNAHQPELSPALKEAIHKIPAEFSDIKHARGVLSMARFDDPNSAETSFSFVLGPAPHLDGQYTVFGEVVQGMDVLAEIEKVEVDEKSTPLSAVRILHVDTVTAAQVPGLTLAPAHTPANTDEPYRTPFLIIVALAFCTTLGAALLKIYREKPPVAPLKTN
jgi:cyclophilin family peptidyl-prolyl cis-trans isomerase